MKGSVLGIALFNGEAWLASPAMQAWHMHRVRLLLLLQLLLLTAGLRAQQLPPERSAVHDASQGENVASLPDAPQPMAAAHEEGFVLPPDLDFRWRGDSLQVAQMSRTEQPDQSRPIAQGFPPISEPVKPRPVGSRQQHPEIPSEVQPCIENITPATLPRLSCSPHFSPYQRFLDSSGPHPLTPKQKGLLAVRNVIDPFNFLTIGVQSVIAVASDPQSPYGPGVGGFGRNFGVAYTETMVSSFFGTFLIPVIAHQDPHYHRMPNASYMRRALHATTSVFWAQSDAGTGMVNYATIETTAIGDALGNLYVPGRQRSWSAGVTRFATALASDPIDNFITEFVPDLARHVNVQIVLIQRVVNEVERQNGGS